MPQLAGFLSPTWETWIKLPSPNLSPVPAFVGIWRGKQQMGVFSLSVYLAVSVAR